MQFVLDTWKAIRGFHEINGRIRIFALAVGTTQLNEMLKERKENKRIKKNFYLGKNDIRKNRSS